jgi:four helix bundle protein
MWQFEISAMDDFPDAWTPARLRERLLAFAVEVCRHGARCHNDAVSGHLARQIVRSASSPAANYAEACEAESRRDFVHKMRVCLKELRETQVWLELVRRHRDDHSLEPLERECGELIAIFVASINTARRRLHRKRTDPPR